MADTCGLDGDHHLVQQGHPGGGVAQPEQGPVWPTRASVQVPVAEPVADLDGPANVAHALVLSPSKMDRAATPQSR